MGSLETHALDRLTKAITLILQGSLCDARDLVSDVAPSESAPLKAVMAQMSALVDSLTDEFSSKESALATVQTATWELEAAKDILRKDEPRFRTTLGSIGDGLITTDVRGRVEFMNPVAEQLTGWTAEHASGQPMAHVFHIVDARTRAEAESPAGRVIDQGVVVDLADHTLLIALDGTERLIVGQCAPIRDAGGEILGTVLVSRDVTDEHRRRELLRESEERYRTVFESAGEGILVIDAETKAFLHSNERWCEMFGYVQEALLGLGMPDIHPVKDREQGIAELEACIRENGRVVSALPCLRKDGSVFFADIHTSALRLDGKPCLLGFFADVTKRRALELSRRGLEDELRHIAFHDALTQLPNRQLLGDRVRQAIALARRNRQHVCVAMLDLDHFKEVNDSLGHEAGDALLREVAGRLVRALREGDTVARMGGDEFVLVLGELAEHHLDLVGELAQRVLAGLREPIDVRGHQLRITGSMGLAIFPDDGEDLETLVRHADAAMYQTKSNDGNGYCLCDHAIVEIATAAFDLDTRLHGALERNEFVLRYQPIVDIATGAISSVEALIRWKPSGHELVPPDRFITLAERSGLIVPIGRWALREACRQAASWMTSSGKRIAVGVKLSARQLQNADLVDTVLEALRHAGLDPSLLQLELTESTIVRDIGETQRTLTRLREHGVLVAVDAFGAGHSSLQRLRSLPIDLLKLDRTFVRNVASDPADATIFAAVVALAHDLGLRVVVGGVETLDQLDCLRTPRWGPAGGHRCDLVQGFYFSGPVPAADIALMIERAEPIGPRPG